MPILRCATMHNFLKPVADLGCNGPDVTTVNQFPVNTPDWRHFCGGASEKTFIGMIEVGKTKTFFPRRDFKILRDFEYGLSRDAGQNIPRGWGIQNSPLHDKNILPRPLGNLATIPEKK